MEEKRFLEITKGRIILTGTLILLVTIFVVIAKMAGTPLESWSLYVLAAALVGGTMIIVQIRDLPRPGAPVKEIPDGEYTVISDIITIGCWKIIALNKVIFDGRLIGASVGEGDFLNEPTLVDYNEKLKARGIKKGDKIKVENGFITKLPDNYDFTSSGD